MRRTNPEPAGDDRLERLLDEELRAVAQGPAVDLRAKVLRALEESAVESGFGRILGPRWAFAAGAAVIVLAVFVTWPAIRREAPDRVAARPPLPVAPVAAAEAPTATVVELPRALAAASARPHRSARVGDRNAETTVTDQSLASGEPYLPGAPAGDLGDPIQPMPSPPPIAFAPISSAPPVSDNAWPVVDFPADNPAPAMPIGTAGQSGGTRR
jgi:hypothetical protein